MNETLRFLRLLCIDLRRVYGYVPVALVWVLMPFATYDYERPGIVLWADVDRTLFATVLYLTAIGGGYGAWVVGRVARRRLEAQDSCLPTPPGRTTAIALTAACIWMTVAYVGAAVWIFQEALREATWGSPNLGLALPVLGATWLALGLGGVLGSLHRSLLIPPLVTAGIYGLQIWGQVDVWKRPEFRLIPMGYIEAYRWWGEVDGFYPRGLDAYALMLVAAAILAFAAVLLTRRPSIMRAVVAVGALAIAIPAGQQTLTARVDTGADGRYESSVERICELAPTTGIEVCLHPAFSKAMENVVATVDQTYAPIAGLAGVPTTMYQTSDSSSDGSVDDGVLQITLFGTETGYLPYQLVSSLFPPRSGPAPGPDPAQCFVFTLLLGDSLDARHACDYHFISFDQPVALEPDEEERRAKLAQVPAKVAAFQLLPPEQQRAWLEANWDALRAGELTLVDLP